MRCVLRLLCGDDPRTGVFVLPPVGFDYRSKIEETRWRNMWAGASSLVASFRRW